MTVDLDYSLRGPGVGSGKRIYILGNNDGNGNRVAAIDVERGYAHTRWQLLTFGAVSAHHAAQGHFVHRQRRRPHLRCHRSPPAPLAAGRRRVPDLWKHPRQHEGR